jgi:hypothetical protein
VCLIDSIIAAAVSFNSKEIKIIGPDVIAKKLYILSQSKKTYVSLLWAGSLIDFTIISKGCKDIDTRDLIDGINDLLKGLPIEIPSHYLSIPNMKPFLNEWNKELDGQVFISIPRDEQYRLGLQLDRFNVVYTKYSDRLISPELMNVLRAFG